MRHTIYGSHWESLHEYLLLSRKSDRTIDAHIRRHGLDRFVHGHAQQTAGLWRGVGAKRRSGNSADSRAPIEGILRRLAAQIRFAAAHGGHHLSTAGVARAHRNSLW